jgi:hypothetical protein
MAKQIKPVEVKEADLFSASLVEALQAQPHIKTVYVNEFGQWLFIKRPGYEAFSVQEVKDYAGKNKVVTFS